MSQTFAFSFDNPRFRLLVLVGFVAGFAVLLYVAGSSLSPFLVALGLAYLMEPAVASISRRTFRGAPLPRWAAVIGVYVALFAIAFVLLVWTARGLRTTAADAGPALQETVTTVRSWLGDESPPTPDPAAGIKATNRLWIEHEDGNRLVLSSKQFVQKVGIDQGKLMVELTDQAPPSPAGADAHDVRPIPSIDSSLPSETGGSLGEYVQANARVYVAWVLAQVQAHSGDLLGLATSVVGRFFTILYSLGLTFMVAAFISSDAPNIARFYRELVPSSHRPGYESLVARVDRGLAGVIRGQLLICLINGSLTGIALFLFVKPVFAFPLTLLVTACSLIPIFGTLISSVPCLLLAIVAPGLIQLGPVFQGLVMLVWLVLIHLLEGNVLNPKIMGKQAEIHPALVIFALVVGGHAYGFVGALLAVAVMSIVQNVSGWCHDRLMHTRHAHDGANAPAREPRDTGPRDTGPRDMGPRDGGHRGGRDGGHRGGRDRGAPRGGRPDGPSGAPSGARPDTRSAAQEPPREGAPPDLAPSDALYGSTPIAGDGPASDREAALARTRERDRSRRRRGRGRGRGRNEPGGDAGGQLRGSPERGDDRGVYERYRDFE